MKGFIEVTDRDNRKILLNANYIECIIPLTDVVEIYTITGNEYVFTVKENYEKIVNRIKQTLGE